MDTEFENYISKRVIEKMSEQYTVEKSKEIYQRMKDEVLNDINIILSQTGTTKEESVNLYLENNGDTVSAICSFFDISKKKKERTEIKNETQTKLDQLRIIANQKDKVYDIVKKQQQQLS